MNIVDPREMIAVLAYRKGGWNVLARELGVSRQYMCHINKGRCPIPDELLAMVGLRRVVTVTYEQMKEPKP